MRSLHVLMAICKRDNVLRTMSRTRERLLSPADLAAYLGIPLGTVYSWRWRGGGPPGFKIGRHVRYRRADVERWLEERQEAETR